ncbi:MAG: right-handed parallel beta-helix repeat-containing protein [bacterium]
MKKINLILLLNLLLIHGALPLLSNNYYISLNGNDKNSGKSPGKSWQSLERLQGTKLKPGDTVFFHAGHHFHGDLVIEHSGSKEKPIVFTSYGEGTNPVLSGTIELKGFKLETPNIYSTHCNKPITNLYKGNELLIVARYPNKGFLKMDGGSFTHFLDEDLDLSKEVIENSLIRFRTINWAYEYRLAKKIENQKVYFDSITYTCDRNWGYFFEGKKEYLDNEGEWVNDKEQQKVYVYSSTPLHENDIFQGNYIDYGLRITKGKSNIQISNLHFTMYDEAGVFMEGDNENVKIISCEFTLCDKRGLFINEGSSHCLVQGNKFSDILGQGIFGLGLNNTTIEYNTIHRIGMYPAYGINGINGGSGIIITNEEKRVPGNPYISHDNIIRHNRLDTIGYHGIRMDGYHSLCEYNVVKDVMFTLNDGGIFYCWGADSTFTHHNVVRNNILLRSHGNLDGTPGGDLMSNGLYIDNRSHHIIAENNIVVGAYDGIMLNDNIYNVDIRNNICYGNKHGIIIAEWKPGNTRDISVTQNTFCAVDYQKQNIFLSSAAGPEFKPGIIDSNLYISLFEKFHLKKMTVHEKNLKRIEECTFEAWQEQTGYDKNSHVVINSGKPNSLNSTIFINEYMEPKVFELEADKLYKDLEGNLIEGQIEVEPFSAKILIFELK